MGTIVRPERSRRLRERSTIPGSETASFSDSCQIDSSLARAVTVKTTCSFARAKTTTTSRRGWLFLHAIERTGLETCSTRVIVWYRDDSLFLAGTSGLRDPCDRFRIPVLDAVRQGLAQY